MMRLLHDAAVLLLLTAALTSRAAAQPVSASAAALAPVSAPTSAPVRAGPPTLTSVVTPIDPQRAAVDARLRAHPKHKGLPRVTGSTTVPTREADGAAANSPTPPPRMSRPRTKAGSR